MPTKKTNTQTNKRTVTSYIKISAVLIVLLVAAMYSPYLIDPLKGDVKTVNTYYGLSYLAVALLGVATFAFGIKGVRLGVKSHHIGYFVLTIIVGAYGVFTSSWVLWALLRAQV